MNVLKISQGLLLLLTLMAGPASARTVAPIEDSTITQCVEPAAAFHKVNPFILKAILKVESAYNARAINRNGNGTVDVGIAQMNSMHFKELSTHGVAPEDLFDPCVGIYVAGWHLAKQLKAHGNTWFAIGAYHSATPYFNSRYQALVFNALVDLKVMEGPKLGVPPLNRGVQIKAPSQPRSSSLASGSGIFTLSQ